MEVVQGNNSLRLFGLKGSQAGTSSPFLYFVSDFLLVNIAFASIALVNQESVLPGDRIGLLGAFYLTWLLTSLLTNKFRSSNYGNYFRGILTFLKSNLLLLYLVSCLIFVFGASGLFQLRIYETLLILFMLETVLFTEYCFSFGKDIFSLTSREALRGAVSGISVFLLCADFIAFTAAFFAMHYFIADAWTLAKADIRALLELYAFWLGSSILTHKFRHRRFRKWHQLLSPNVKAIILSGICYGAVLPFVNFPAGWEVQFAGTLALSLVLGALPNALYAAIRLGRKWQQSDIQSAEEVKYLLQQEELAIEPPAPGATDEISVEASLRDAFLTSFPELFEMMKRTLELSKIKLRAMEVFYSNTDLSTVGIYDKSVELLINLDRINDIKRLNRYFLDVHKKLANGGILICKGETIDIQRRHFVSRRPIYFRKFLYLFKFLCRRVLPALPGFKVLHFAFTRGRNKLISRAEFLGRLYFCGFKVLAGEIIGDDYYVIAQKVKTPSKDTNPSNDLIIEMKRVGYQGEIIELKKLRTMFPYSEYLQEYVYERNKLQSNGKFKSDFRITEWGKVFRKFWIDELPQFLNYFRGELNLVGVRALSKQYFDLYPKDLQKLRIKFKPGIIPPYYYDMPSSFEEIILSERRYLQQKELKPLSTDIKYFFVALYNIFARGARSK